MFVNEVGSGNLVSNTGALAKLGAVLAAGGAPLVSSPEAITRATRVYVEGHDPVFDWNVAFTECGWSPITKFSESATLRAAAAEENGLVGWWGIGGQLFVFSPARNLSFAFQSSLCSVTHGPRLPAYPVLESVLSAL